MLGTLLYIFGTLCIIVYAIYKYFSGNQSYWPKRNVYLLDPTKFASTWERLSFKYPVHELENMQYKYFKSLGIQEGYCGLMEFRRPIFYVTDLDLIKNIMVKDFEYFVNRRTFDVEKTDPHFHKMLISTKDQEWKDLRSTLSPTFTTGKIRRMYTCFNESSNKLADFIKETTIKSGSTEIDFHDTFTRYTMDVISSAAFGLDSEAFKDINSAFCVNAKRIQNQFAGKNIFKLMIMILFPKLFGILRIPLFDVQASNFFVNIIHRAVEHRERTGDKREDFLQLLLESRNSTNTTQTEESVENDDTKLSGKIEKVQMTEQLITAQSLIFFIAGFDTTESLLVFAAYELAVNPETQDKLYEELKNAADDNEGALNYDIVMKLEYLDKVVSETLRKYPPAIRTERVAGKPYPISAEFTLEKDIIVAVPMYGIHHDETYYPDPEKFNPERFSDENKDKRHPYAYMPFGVGPRNCIASRFALAEGKSAIAHLILNFKLEPGKKTEIPVKMTMATMKPEGGLWLDIKPRN